MYALPAVAAREPRPVIAHQYPDITDVRGYGSNALYLINEALARARMSEDTQRREPKVRGALWITAAVRRREREQRS